VVGGDLVRKANYNLGFFAGTGRSDMDEHDHIDQDLEGRFFHVGAYHHYQMSNDYFLNSMATLFEGDFDSERQNYDTNGGYAAESESDFKMQGGTVGVKLARHFRTSETTLITPTVGLSYTRIEQDSIKESGGGDAYDYKIEEADAEAVVLGIGLDFAKSFAGSSKPIILDMMLRYEYDAYADDNETHDIKAGLAGQESSTFVGQNRGAHGLLVGIGLESETSKNLTLGGGVVYSERSNGSETQINGNLTYYW
jgi:outer membrane autotransporter protein